jgi:uncharacterized protein (TIGR01777 family)
VRIVVTGGTGFVGKALVHTLVGRGDDVVVLTRGAACRPNHACAECKNGGKVELVHWDPAEPGPWQETVEGSDGVVHLAGASVLDGRWTSERKQELVSSRVRSTELVAQAIAKARRKPSVFVSASAVGYYGTAAGDRVLEETDAPGSDFLATLTRDWEAAAKEAGVRTVLPRIGIVLGRGGGALAQLLPMFRAFMGGPVGSGAQFMAWIHLRDVVRALEHAIARPDVDGPINVTGPEPVTMDTFAATLAKTLGRPAAVRVPAFAVRLAMGEAAEVVLTGQRAVPKRLVDSGFAFVFPELASALADLV